MIFELVEQVLTDVDNRQIAVMQNFGEYVGHERVYAVHEIVKNQSDGRFPSKILSFSVGSPLWKCTNDR